MSCSNLFLLTLDPPLLLGPIEWFKHKVRVIKETCPEHWVGFYLLD